MSFWETLFGIRKTKSQPENMTGYDLTTPGLSQWVTFGHNNYGETAAVVLNEPEKHLHKVIVNHSGHFDHFPGIVKGKWIKELEGAFDFDSGKICYRTDFERHGAGYRCLWEIQPDGRYWADDDGFGMQNDTEIVLYADLDESGNFISPFRIYSLDGKRIDESDELA